jgi:hypothetical protein
MTTIVLKHSEWRDLRQRIDADYGSVVSMVSWRLKETLGFTVRHHTGFSVWNKRYEDDIRLDFVDDERLVFFKLKYYDN